jgi:hypothetical protein
MKKLFSTILVICSSLGGNVYSNEAPYYENSLNKNILEYGWEIVSKTDGGLVATEIYTLKKDNWTLICNVDTAQITTICALP